MWLRCWKTLAWDVALLSAARLRLSPGLGAAGGGGFKVAAWERDQGWCSRPGCTGDGRAGAENREAKCCDLQPYFPLLVGAGYPLTAKPVSLYSRFFTAPCRQVERTGCRQHIISSPADYPFLPCFSKDALVIPFVATKCWQPRRAGSDTSLTA